MQQQADIFYHQSEVRRGEKLAPEDPVTFLVSYNPRTKRHNATVVRKDVIPKDAVGANKENVNVAGTDRATTTTTSTSNSTAANMRTPSTRTTRAATASPSMRATRATTTSPPGFMLSEEDDALIWRASLAEQVAAATRLALSTTTPIKPRARSVNHVSLIDYDRRAEDGMLTTAGGGGGGGGGGDDPFHAAAGRGFGGFGGANGGGIGGVSSSARRVSRGRSESGSGWADGGAATWSRGPDEGSSAAGNSAAAGSSSSGGSGGSGGSTGFGAAQWQRTVQCGDGETLVVDRRQMQVRDGSKRWK